MEPGACIWCTILNGSLAKNGVEQSVEDKHVRGQPEQIQMYQEDLEWNQHAGGTGVHPFPPARPQAADAPTQTRLHFSGQHRETAVLRFLEPWCSDSDPAPMQEPEGGEGEQGRGCKHIWHLQNPADTHNIMRETYRPCRRESTVFPLLSHMQRKIDTPTQLCAYYL